MIWRVGLVGLAVVIVLAERPARGQEAAAQTPTFRSATNLVFVNVSVKRGRGPLAGLTGDDFELLDNGARQTAELIPSTGVPIDLTLIVEDTPSSRYRVGRELKGDLSKIARLLRPVDRLEVIATATTARDVLPMQPVGDQARWDLQGLGPSNRDSLKDFFDPDLQWGSLLDTLLLTMAQPVEPDRRHVIVAFTLGQVVTDILGLDRIEPIARRSEALLHVALAPPLQGKASSGTFRVEDTVALRALTRAAEATGGGVYNLADAVGAVRSVLDDFRRGYVLRYTARGAAPGWHQLDVRTPKCADCVVRARAGYFVG